jgi:choice-of-anchor B domain-containing protein
MVGSACSSSGDTPAPPAAPPPATPTLGTGPAPCRDGVADDFGCSGVALKARVPYPVLSGSRGNDIWGWTDPDTGAEYALVGMTNGTAFVDVSVPESPTFLGRLPTVTSASTWRDIKVFANHAFVVADNAGAHGMQVFDLTRLRGLAAPQTFSADVTYGDFENSHNIAIDEASGFAYAVGTNTCNGGLHIIDIREPKNPLAAGCFDAAATHDVQCVVYAGPDLDYVGREICIGSNRDHVGIADVTVKPGVEIASIVYPEVGFTHQGWLTDDHRYFFLGDERDEADLGVTTRTHVFDFADLDAPLHLYFHSATTASIDHNMYVLGNRLYQANYTAGLRVLEFGDLANGEIAEVAFFDTYPANDAVAFSGAWSVYPYFPSGTIVVSDTDNGLFVLSVDAP